MRERIVALGYQEIVEIPLVDKDRDVLFRPESVKPAVIGNPLAEDASVMRSTGAVSMVGALEWNLNHGQRNLRLFEIGKTYELRDGEPVETTVLTLGATGLAREKTIHEPAREFGFEDLKGDLDRIGELAGGFAWQAGGPDWLAGSRAARISLGRANKTAETLGAAGQLARRITDAFKIRQDAFVAELRLQPLLEGIEAARAAARFVPLPRFPAVERDFSLVLADGVSFAQVEEAIRSLGIPELQTHRSCRPVPRRTSASRKILADDSRDVPERAERHFTDAQLSDFSSRIVAALEQQPRRHAPRQLDSRPASRST